MKVPEINLAEEEYIKYSIDEIKEEVIIHFKESDVIMGLMDFNKLIEERMDKIEVIDEEIIHGNIIDLTENSYSKYKLWGKYDSMYLYFDEWIIEIGKRDFNRLKEDIIEQEDGLIKEEDLVAISVVKTPKKRTLLKELIKTTDEITDLTNRYDSTYFTLMEDMECPRFKDELEVKNKLRPMWKKRNKLINYKEKLEAQLKYGELQ